jgi:hypothetical protein
MMLTLHTTGYSTDYILLATYYLLQTTGYRLLATLVWWGIHHKPTIKPLLGR